MLLNGSTVAAGLRLFTLLPICTLSAFLAVCLLAPAAVTRAALMVAMAGLLIGVPHGAVDHVVPRWAEQTATRAATGALICAYVSSAVTAAAALLSAPTAAVLAFLVLSALHFGTAESAFGAERRGEGTPPPWARLFATGAHGATVVGLLLWVHPGEVDPWLRHLAPGAADIVAGLRIPGLIVVGLLVLGQVAAALRRIRIARAQQSFGGSLHSDVLHAEVLPLAEEALVLVVFVIAPPLAALGVYFGSWHALRHTGRLLDLARRPGDRSWRPATRRLATTSLVPSAVALAAMASLVLARDRAPVVVEVAVLLALTFPHSAVVWYADVRRHGLRRDCASSTTDDT